MRRYLPFPAAEIKYPMTSTAGRVYLGSQFQCQDREVGQQEAAGHIAPTARNESDCTGAGTQLLSPVPWLQIPPTQAWHLSPWERSSHFPQPPQENSLQSAQRLRLQIVPQNVCRFVSMVIPNSVMTATNSNHHNEREGWGEGRERQGETHRETGERDGEISLGSQRR